ncbi:LOW QUALITY PROTEIN: uncharacterized protein LOC127576871 [Pristis pectinata]|uniref:LOW QUALITY PROTEIN: uncharacterized protein LOC127576871 n=1 Tax=Pristis pectinata TaxID=685728 RepID=UPI00223D6C96|nr:LOW QUALITY PROTEIN: uncharacterized protein LOC127576871 [Pristis pectinata]
MKICLFCCLRREKLKEHSLVLEQPKLEVGEEKLSRQEQTKINPLGRRAEEFLNAVLQKRDNLWVVDPTIPLVAREIMHRMIREFAAEYTSKTSTSQDSIVLSSTKDQSTSKTPVLGASALNPVLSKLLMADQDRPLDLTVKKYSSESDNQDGVLDLSTKKSPCAGNVSASKFLDCSSSAVLAKGRPGRSGQQQLDCESQSIEGALPKSLRSFQTVTQDGYGSSVILKIPVTRSAQKGEEPINRNEASSTSNLGPTAQHRGQHLVLAREAPWAKPHYEFNLEHASFRGNDARTDAKELSSRQVAFQRGSVQTKHDAKKDQGCSASVDLKIPQVRGMDLTCGTNVTNHYTCSPLLMNSQIESALHRKLRVILPKQNLWHRKGVVSLSDGGHDSWDSFVDQPTSSKQQGTPEQEGDSKQPRKKRGRYRQYNNEILEEAITVVMNGKMSVSKAQSTYGIPHSTLEYKVKERLGTLKNPPKKKLKLISAEPQEVDDELEHSPSNSKADDSNIPSQEVQLSKEPQGSLDQFMAKLCRHHQKQFMSVLSHMHSEAGPESESVEHEDMAASSPAPQQQQAKNAGDPLRSRATFQSCPSFNRATSIQSDLNCENGTEGKEAPGEGPHVMGSEVCGATSAESPAALGGCSGGTLIKNSTVGARSSSKGMFTNNCSKTGNLEALQKETVNRKLISNSLLGLSSSDCALISTANRIEGVSSCNQKNKIESTVTAKGQKETLRALPMQLLNLRKNLIKSQNGPQSGSGAGSDHKAIKRVLVHGGPQESATATKRTVKGNHVLPTAASAKDCWVFSKSRPGGRGANGRLRLKVQSPPTKTARKSTRVTVPRARSSVSTVCQYVNEHDNQCDIVYISKPITECRFDTQRSWSSTRKTARKSTRGHLCNEEYWELKTVRTSARNPVMEARKESLASFVPNPPAPVTPKPVLSLPVSVPVVGIPVTVGTGIHGAKGQEKTLPKQNLVQELEENLSFNCSANCAEKVINVSQACQLQEANASSMNGNDPEGEQKRPSGQVNSPSSENCPASIRGAQVPNVHRSKCTTVQADSREQGKSLLAARPSVEPLGKLLEECRSTEQSLSGLEQLVKERDEMKGNSSAKDRSSLNHLEPSLNNGNQDPSVSYLDNVGISPVNSIEINLPQNQCSKQNNNSSELLNGDLGELSHGLCKPMVESQQPEHSNKSVENVDKVKVEKLLTEKDYSKGSGITLCLPPKSVACSVMPKSDLHPQPASIHEGKSRCSDPGQSTLEVVEGQGTGGIECPVPVSNLCLRGRKPEDLDANVPDHKRKEDIRAMRSLQHGRNISPIKEETSIPPASEKRKQRKRLMPAPSDRCLRSQQSQPQTVVNVGNVKEEPMVSADGLLVPCLSVKFPRNQGEKGYRREVCISRVTSVQFPVDCFNKTLLQSIIDPESKVDESLATTSMKDVSKMRKPAVKQVASQAPGEEPESSEDEELITDSFVREKTLLKQGRILEVCVDVKSAEERQVSFSIQNAGTTQVSESSSGSVDDVSTSSQQQSGSRKIDAHKESAKRASGGLAKRVTNFGSSHQTTKGVIAKVSPGDKKIGVGSRDLRCLNTSVTESETRVLEEDTECTTRKLPTEVIQEDEESEPSGVNDADATEVSRPKFLDWCSEDENQELITTLNAKYESLHKAWIQLEKEGPVIQKAKSKTDRLKEIWKSRKRARKVRGLYDHKISPVQKLFVANFNLANICKWFMETTETKSLVIVKNVSARNPLEAMKAKTFLQKSSMAGLFPSPQAERLKKHLKKFAMASPARNNSKTRALLDSVRRMSLMGGERARQQQDLLPDAGGGLSPRDLFLAKGPDGQEEGAGPPSSRMAPQLSKHLGLKKPVSAWILRKYSNMMGKLHKFQHGKEQAGRKHTGKHKSVCMNPLVSPKLTSQTQLDSPRNPLPAAPRRPEESKGKRKGPRDAPIKEPRLARAKTSKSEAISPALPSKSTPKQFPASRKPKADGSSSKPPAPKKAGGGGKSSSLPTKTFPKSTEKRSPSTGLKIVPRSKNRSRTRDRVRGTKVNAKKKSSVGKERQTKQAQRKAVSPAKAKQRDKTGTKIRNKAAIPAKHRPKCDVSSEAKQKKRKLSEKGDPVPNKRKRTDAK